MSKTKLGMFASAIGMTLAVAGPAGAQLHDHLECHKIKDTQQFKAFGQIAPIPNPPFLDTGCKIVGKGAELCVPAAKTLIQSDAPGSPFVGPELTNGFVCYKVSCTSQPVAGSIAVEDQFGSRHVIPNKKIFRLCAPAQVG